MKVHSSDFKENIKEIGRQFDSILSYTNGSELIELGSDKLNSVTAHYEGSILKSVMRCLDVDSNVEIPKGSVVNYQYGIVVGTEEDQQTGEITDVYEYINFGDYIVNEVEKQEGTNSYKLKCYDKMLYSMVDYERLGKYSLTEDTTFQEHKNYYTYTDSAYTLYTGDRTGNPVTLGLYEYTFEPITIDEYIKTICDHLGLIFKNYGETYANSDKVINEEFYIAADGTSLNFTFRDVFDDLAEVTASTIVINEEDGELEIRYINETNDTIDAEYLKDVKVDFGQKYGPINSIVLSRSAESDNVYLKDDESIAENGLCELKIIDNEIMNLNDRDQYLPDILEKLDGLEFYLNDYSSTGICYYNICDKYNVEITRIDDETEEETTVTYPCIMFNDEVLITQGLEENIFTKAPDGTQTDYKNADTTDQRINKAYIIVKKNEGEIESLISRVGENEEEIFQVKQTAEGITNNYIINSGTNLLYNTSLAFKDSEGNFTYWQVEPKQIPQTEEYGYLSVINDTESLTKTNMVLPIGKAKQTIEVIPGDYSFSFSYKQNLLASQNCTFKINEIEYPLETEKDWYELKDHIFINENTITVEFDCDLQGGFYIKELMLIRGTESVEWQQNANETNTSSVKISDGIEVTSTSTNTISRHDSDGFRILKKDTEEVVLKATDSGTETKSIKVFEDSEINGLIIIRKNNHIFLTGKGSD